MTENIYAREVLGIKNYLCPNSIYDSRRFTGMFPAKVLVIALKELSPSQKLLLKKIMHSINIDEYSLLEIKKSDILAGLFSKLDSLAKKVLLFAGKDFFQDSSQKNPSVFQSPYSLQELEETSQQVQKKQQLWNELKNWKNNLY